MPTLDDPVQIYRELSDCYERRQEPPMRDRFLVLAADAALSKGRVEESEKLRQRLLKMNPHHLLKPYASFTQALQAPDVQTYIRDLRLNYPPEVAIVLLNSLRTSNAASAETAGGPVPKPHGDDDQDATVALGEPMETFKVFPDQHEPDITETAALPQELIERTRRPLASQPPAKLPLAAPPTPPPSKNTLRPQTVPTKKLVAGPRPVPAPSLYLTSEETQPASGGNWLAVGLFLIVLAAALGQAVYTFGRPFWH